MKRRKIIAILLAVLLLAGCFGTAPDIIDPTLDPAEGEARPTPIPLDTDIPCDGRLSVSYYSGSSLNPYTTTSWENLALGGFLYEGLFALEENFTAAPVLAQNLTTVDGMRYTLEIRRGIPFHSGDYMTVEDVIYSLERAQSSPHFEGRLALIEEVSRRHDAEGEILDYELEIILDRVHGNLPVLLTFPIIQSGTMGWRAPAGTGPYQYTDEGGPPRLLRFDGHRYGADLPIDIIHLIEVDTMEQQARYFNTGLLDIVPIDPTGAGMPHFSAHREVRYYEATLMDFIGFNMRRPETGRREVRQAISYAIDRDYIVDNILFGQAVASPLPLHPALAYFDHELAAAHSLNMELAMEMIERRWAFLDAAPPPRPPEAAYEENLPPEEEERPEENGEAEEEPEEEEGPERPELIFLVAGDHILRMEVVVYIAERISALGYRVQIVDLPFNDYLAALQNGEFDLFYGQIRLQPDFDLTELLFGSAAYGSVEGLMSRAAVNQFLASGHADRAEAAAILSDAFLETMPLAVICFRHLAVATMRGTVSGMRPTQDNPYHGVANWTVNLRS